MIKESEGSQTEKERKRVGVFLLLQLLLSSKGMGLISLRGSLLVMPQGKVLGKTCFF